MFGRFVIGAIGMGALIGLMMPGSPRTVPPPAPAPASHHVDFEERVPALPPSSSNTSDRTGDAIILTREVDGHFYADAKVNGMPVRFLVDTGATGVALSRHAADIAGVATPMPDEVVGTGASGEVRGSHVTLQDISLGSKAVQAMPAIVLSGGDRSLLGQRFLSRFASITIDGDTMTMR